MEFHLREDCMMTMVHCPYEGAGCTFHDKRSNLNDHLKTTNEEHLRKTWSKLLKTTKRLNELEAVEGQIEELQTDKKSMKRLLDGNSEEISDLKRSAKNLEVENMVLKKDLASLQKQLEEVKLIAADDKEEVRSLKAEYKALKKDVEELRCSKGYPGEKAKSEKTVCWEYSDSESYREKSATKIPCEEKQKQCKKDGADEKKAEPRWAKSSADVLSDSWMKVKIAKEPEKGDSRRTTRSRPK